MTKTTTRNRAGVLFYVLALMAMDVKYLTAQPIKGTFGFKGLMNTTADKNGNNNHR